ncbi:MAG: hypothetical protein Q9167_003974 [Letrouitia subvulpina]
MLLAFATTAWLLLAGQVHGMPQVSRVIPRLPVDYSLMHHDAYVAHKHSRRAHPVLNHEAYHQRNVLPTSIVAEPSATAIALPANSPNVNAATSWDAQTEAACVKSLATMNGQASNPSGMAVCYNVRSFNSTSGAFQADLRLYRIAPPDKVWGSLKTQGVNVGLSYNGASVAPSNANKVKRDDEIISWPPIKSNKIDALRLRRATTLPIKLQDMSFVGKVNSNLLSQMKDKTKAHDALIPNIALSGTAKNGTIITTELSSKDASFVNGVFADQTTKSTSAATSASSAAASANVFVLPGKSLGIFPVGLIITAAWTFLFIVAVGFGTIERIRFREAYRRRVKYRMAMVPKPTPTY